jgi:hypothetical protein
MTDRDEMRLETWLEGSRHVHQSYADAFNDGFEGRASRLPDESHYRDAYADGRDAANEEIKRMDLTHHVCLIGSACGQPDCEVCGS